MQAPAKLNGFLAVGRLSDHLEEGLRVEYLSDRLPNKGMVVGYDSPCRSTS
jgi:hypothetical protein